MPVSVKFIQCQTVLRNALKTSPNESIKQLWKSTNQHTNIQYDVYNSTKEVQEDKLKHHLICQGSFFSNVAKFSLLKLNSLWSTAQSKLPRNIFNFTVRYINSSLPTRKNLTRWGLSFSPECSFCLCPETLLHVVAGCQSYLRRFTWIHDSILNFIAETLQTTCAAQIYADLPGFGIIHQRSCWVIHGLNDELLADLEELSTKDSGNGSVHSTAEDIDNMANNTENQSFPALKKGINLPKSDAYNNFKFMLQLSAPIRDQDLSSSIIPLDNVVLTILLHVEKIPDKEFVNKYKDQTVKDLKKSLKLSNADPCEIRYVSRTLRDKLRNATSISVKNTTQSTQPKTFNHDNLIGKNFWSYVKNILQQSNSLLPSFTMSICVSTQL